MAPKAATTEGFTLIELMLVVAIIGLLAAIAIPKFADLVIKAKEAAIRGKLGTIRSAVSIYYADNEGIPPQQFSAVTPKYLSEIPFLQIPTVPTHLLGNMATWVGLHDTGLGIVDEPVWDGGNENGGGWIMVWGFSNVTGRFVVNCTHTDSKGTTWSLW